MRRRHSRRPQSRIGLREVLLAPGAIAHLPPKAANTRSFPRRACALATAISLFAAAPAYASFAGSNGSLASEFREIDRGGANDMEIQVFGLNGKVGARVSPCSRPELEPASGTCPKNPAFSPDGKRIAFDLEGRLAIAAPDGSGLFTLPKFTAADADPAFSPDGTRVVFTGLVGGKRNLYVVGIDGSALTQITRAGGKWPAWSSGGQIAYHAVGQVWRLRPGSGRTRVAEGRYPDWSASGKSIAYDFKRNTYRVPARKGAARKLMSRQAERPVFSPDSKRIAFERPLLIDKGKDSLGAFIYTADVDTGKRPKLIRRGGEQPVGSTYDYFTGVAWQPRP